MMRFKRMLYNATKFVWHLMPKHMRYIVYKLLKRNIPWNLMNTKSSVQMPVCDVLLAQFYDNDFGNYKHCDGAVRQMALEQELGLNNYGFDLYERMLDANVRPEGFGISRFSRLIASYMENGFDNANPISLAKNLSLLDGSHRLTLANYFGQDFITVKVLNGLNNRVFDNDFFWENGFTRDECKMIYAKSAQMLKSLRYSYFGIIWPPAFPFADDIIADMRAIDLDVTIDNIKDYEVDRNDFEHILRALYYTDIMTPQGARLKTDHVFESVGAGKMRFRTFELFCEEPKMAANARNYMPQSRTCVRFKKIIRRRYAPLINKYQLDICMHLSDNYYQSKFSKLLFSIDRDLTDLFAQLKDLRYVAMPIKESHQSESFPKNFSIHSDIDILCDDKDVMELCKRIRTFVEEKYNTDWMNVTVKDIGRATAIYINIRDYWISAFEVSTGIDGVTPEYAKRCLDSAISKEFKYLPDELEAPLRIVRYIKRPYKEWHLNWIKKHMDLVEKNEVLKTVDSRLKRKAARLLEALSKGKI